MHVLLLSGGSGKRLWPLSNETRSKQFIPLFKTENGYCSMIQRVVGQFKKVDPEVDITIATSQNQADSIIGQIGQVDLSIEPCRRDTLPAIALATAFLHDVKGIDENETVVVCPVDQYADDSYYAKQLQQSLLANKGDFNLVLMGITPSYPSEKYGYIFVQDGRFAGFKEKPDKETAQQYIEKGALWNAGVFAYKLKYLLEIARKQFGTSAYDQLLTQYPTLPKISFDYGVVEKEENIGLVMYSGSWKDVGTWDALPEVLDDTYIGTCFTDDHCQNTHIINELHIPLLAMGLKDIIVVASPDGIFVADKKASTNIKPYADKIQQPPMFENQRWGTSRTVDAICAETREGSLTKHLTVYPGSSLPYAKHDCRKEVWTILCGQGEAVINGIKKEVKAGDTLTIPVGTLHTLRAITELHLMEVQIGNVSLPSDEETAPYKWE